MPSLGLLSPTAALCTPTATGCSARWPTPRTHSKTRCLTPGEGSRSSRGEARCARGCTRSRPTPACERSSGGPSGCCRSTTRPPPTPTTAWPNPWSNRSGSSPIPTSAAASRTGSPVRRRVTSSARASSSPSSRRSSTCQRAVLILRDVLGFSARETAAALEMSSPGVDSALQRAHKAVDERLPDRSQQAVLGSLDDQGLREIVDRYVDAFERADVDAVVEMLAADGAFTMPPLPTWYRGREAVAAFLKGHVLASENRWRLVPARANGQVAFGNYRWDEERQSFLPRSISVLTLDGEGIAEITTFLGPELLSSFGLPDEVPPGPKPPMGDEFTRGARSLPT